jgi:hypothetical protein
VKLSAAPSLGVVDYFTPFDQAAAAQNDTDLGSGGAVVLPDLIDASGRVRHLVIGAGKDQNIYLADRDNLGKFNPQDNSNLYQEVSGELSGEIFSTPAYFNYAVYFGPVGGSISRFGFNGAQLFPTPTSSTPVDFGYPGVTPSISSLGTANGIVWAYQNSFNNGNTGDPNPAVLHAFDTANLNTELYNTNQNSSRDQFGLSDKFITPTISNGKVFAGTTSSVGVFGLLAPTRAVDVTGQITVTLFGFRYDAGTGHFLQSVVLTNHGNGPIYPPMSLVFDNLSPEAVVVGAAGATTEATASFYVNALTSGILAAGQSAFVNLEFVDPDKTPIVYTPRILAGLGNR